MHRRRFLRFAQSGSSQGAQPRGSGTFPAFLPSADGTIRVPRAPRPIGTSKEKTTCAECHRGPPSAPTSGPKLRPLPSLGQTILHRSPRCVDHQPAPILVLVSPQPYPTVAPLLLQEGASCSVMPEAQFSLQALALALARLREPLPHPLEASQPAKAPAAPLGSRPLLTLPPHTHPLHFCPMLHLVPIVALSSAGVL